MPKQRNRLFDLAKSAIAIFISRIFGLLRDAFTTHFFNVSTLDVFTASFKIPNTFRSLFAEGALNNSFVPIYCSIEDEKEKQHYLNSFFTNFFIILVLSVTLLIIFADKFIPFLVLGFSNISTQKTELTVLFTRYFFLYLFFISIVAFISAILNSYYHFFTAYFNQVYFNFTFIVVIIFALIFKRLSTYTLIYCVIISGLFQMIIMFFFLLKYKIKLRLTFDFKNKYLKESWKLFLTSLISSSTYQINILISTYFLSFFEGANTYTYIAQRLYLLPVGLFSDAFSQVFLAYFSNFKQNHEKENELYYSLNLSFFISLPIIAYFMAFGNQILKILFYHGKYTLNDISYSYKLLLFYMPGMLFVSLNKTFVSFYYSIKNIKIPVINSFISLTIFILLNIILLPFFNLYTVSLANTLALFFQTIFFIISFNKRKYIITKPIFYYFKYIVVVTILALIFMYLNKLFPFLEKVSFNLNTLKNVSCYIFLSILFAFAFIFLSIILKFNEIIYIINIFKEKLKFYKNKS
jgi:putative peptidoglycan lipid II flippase